MISPIKALFLGANDTGAVEIRGRQIASQRENWKHGVVEEAGWADIVCIVKWPDAEWIDALDGHVVVLDVLDFWRQPADSIFYEDQDGARSLLRQHLQKFPKLSGAIYATDCMLKVMGDLTPNSIAIPHHFRPETKINPIRDDLVTVGYEGTADFLGEWGSALKELCCQLQMGFIVGPGSLADVDVAIACRGRMFRNAMELNFKSGLKLINAMAAGTPALFWPEAGYAEVASKSVRWFQNPEAVAEALIDLRPRDVRAAIKDEFLAHSKQFSVDRIADRYEHYFLSVLEGRKALAA